MRNVEDWGLRYELCGLLEFDFGVVAEGVGKLETGKQKLESKLEIGN
jgi:hypothetical protein